MMDTVDLVLVLLGTLSLTTIGAIAWALREHLRAEAAQREMTRLVAQQRMYSAGYDTGLKERPVGNVLHT